MSSAATVIKFHPLLDATKLKAGYPFLRALKIVRKGTEMDIQEVDIDKHVLNNWPATFKSKAYNLFEEYFITFIEEQTKLHRKQKSGIHLEKFLEKSTMNYFREATMELRGELDLKLYHKVKIQGAGKYQFQPCRISDVKPVLHFEIKKNAQGELYPECLIQINETYFAPKQLQRFGFLLRNEDEYYILPQHEMETLELIEEQRYLKFSNNKGAFAEHVVKKLEERYIVNRNGVFDTYTIECTPENSVLLSEISGSFLMITPQWHYDHLMVEGPYKTVHSKFINGDQYDIIRNSAAENNFVEYLKGLHPTFAKQKNGYFYLSFDEARMKHWFLKTFHQWLDDNIDIRGMDMLKHFRYSPFAIETKIDVMDEKTSSITLRMKVYFGKEEVSLTELRKMLLSAQTFVMLKDDSMGILTDDWVKKYGLLLKHGSIKKDLLSVPKWIFLAIQSEYEQKELNEIIPLDWRQKWLRWQDGNEVVFEAPKNLNATMRPYQQKGFEWMMLLSEIGAGACLADDMGLGKTLQTIAFVLKQLEKDPSGSCMIVCPASLMYNWQKEFEKFAPEIGTYLYYQSKRNAGAFQDSGAQVLICSYGTMRGDIELLNLIPWNVVVIDESHSIKNLQAQTTRSALQIQANYRIALSGTPVMNNTEDLYPQLQFIVPELLGSAEFFRKEYAVPIDRHQDAYKIKLLQNMTQPFILRRTKAQVAADLPEKIESVLWCEMGLKQKDAYETAAASIRGNLFRDIKKEGIKKQKLNILQGIQQLRQICASPILVKEGEYPFEDSVKLDMLTEELSLMKGSKALVFSQFKGMLKLIAQRLNKKGIPFYHFDGDTPVLQRQEMVSAFQEEDNDVKVFLISLMAGNTGLTLTAADYVFLTDPWWNTAVQQQAIDRTHRIGQDKKVFAFQMICKDTIEERILQMQQRKKAVSDNIIGEEEGFVKNLTEEDITFLFS